MVFLPDTMRPGVFVRTCVRSSRGGAGRGRRVAVVGQAAGGVAGQAVKAESLEALAAFGVGSALYEMGRVLLGAGAAPLWAVAAGADYTAALAAVESLDEVGIVVTDGGGSALAAHAEACAQAGRERIGLLAATGVEAAITAAAALKSGRVVVVCDGGSKPHCTAAAFAAVIASGETGGNLNGVKIPYGTGFDGSLTAAQIERLLQAGVCPFEAVGDAVECVRALTSLGKSGGDRTFAELSAVLAVDEVVAAVRTAVKLRLHGLKNNGITRESIASQILVELEAKRLLGVIDSYDAPLVETHPQDAAICVATLTFRVAPELSQVVLAAEITV